MTTTNPDTGEQRGRPREAALDARILTATQDLLIAHGYAGTTLDAVAAAAGCGKSAIYRRWSGKADLVVASVKQLQSARPLPDTGSLRGDLLESTLHYARESDRAAMALARILTELGSERELFDVAYPQIGRPPVAAIVAVIERWKDRGEIRADAPIELIASIVPSVAFGSVSLQRRSLEAETIVRLVDEVLLPALIRHPSGR